MSKVDIIQNILIFGLAVCMLIGDVIDRYK